MKHEYNEFGIDVVARHDYDDEIVLFNIHQYVEKAVDFIIKKIKNYYQPVDLDSLFLMDIGAGDGYALKLFNEKGFDQTKLWGIDKYPPEVTHFPVNTFNFYNINQLKLIDVIFLNHTLEHAADAPLLIHNIERILKPGGLIFVSVPHGNDPWAYSLEDSTTHFSLFTPPFLETSFKRFGFEKLYLKTRNLRPANMRPKRREIWYIGKKTGNIIHRDNIENVRNSYGDYSE